MLACYRWYGGAISLAVREQETKYWNLFHTIEFLTKSIGSFFILWPNSLHSLATGSYLNKGTHEGMYWTEYCREVFEDKRYSGNRTKWEMIY